MSHNTFGDRTALLFTALGFALFGAGWKETSMACTIFALGVVVGMMALDWTRKD